MGWEPHYKDKRCFLHYSKGAVAVFTDEGQEQINNNIQIYKNNAKILMEVLDELGVFDYLLNEVQVVGTLGEGFDACGEVYFRFSTFGSPEDTKEAARCLVKLLSNN